MSVGGIMAVCCCLHVVQSLCTVPWWHVYSVGLLIVAIWIIKGATARGTGWWHVLGLGIL